jgi:hypothetical protein
MIRVVRTLWSASLDQAVAIVLAYSDLVLISALRLLPIPIIDVMAGNVMDAADRTLMSYYIVITVVAWAAAPILLLILVGVFAFNRWGPSRFPERTIRCSVKPLAWVNAMFSVIAGIVLCVEEQPPLQIATVVRQLVDREMYRETLDFLAHHTRSDFPPHWRLPPWEYRAGGIEERFRLARFYLTALESPGSPDWVKNDLQHRVSLGLTYLGERMTGKLSTEELEKLVDAIETAADNGFDIGPRRSFWTESNDDPRREEQFERLRKLYSDHWK